jgi:hypothetical protein
MGPLSYAEALIGVYRRNQQANFKSTNETLLQVNFHAKDSNNSSIMLQGNYTSPQKKKALTSVSTMYFL